MINKKLLLGMLVLSFVFAQTVAAGGTTQASTSNTPTANVVDDSNKVSAQEPNLQPSDLWYKWVLDGSTVTVDFSLNADGVCAITVGGEADERWKAIAGYGFGGRANTAYEYVFEAWTTSGTRTLDFGYYSAYLNNDEIDLGTTVEITNQRKTYRVNGERLPKTQVDDDNIAWSCGDKTGTFFIRVLGIYYR